MNSESKLCPACQGRCIVGVGTDTSAIFECVTCEGTGVVQPPNPPTAGSELPTGSFSRRRSLPALAKVLKRIVTMRDAARILRDDADQAQQYALAFERSIRVIALNDVLTEIDEMTGEEPEGNTEADRP